MLMAWWGCGQLSAPHYSCSFHPLPPRIVFGDFAITCSAWSSSLCMQIWHLRTIWSRMLKPELKACLGNACPWHAGGRWEQARVHNWYIHHYLGPPRMRARKVPKGDSPMSEPEKLSVFNPCAPLSSCYCAWVSKCCGGGEGELADALPKCWVWDQSSCT